MGLDIQAFASADPWADAPEDLGTDLYVNPDFPTRADGLVTGKYITGDSFNFRAGSYSGYNAWRREMARLVETTPEALWELDPAEKSDVPFYELIHFADNEGVIGPETSAKLAKDFGALRDKAQDFEPSEGPKDWFLRNYEYFAFAFFLASKSGAVRFC